MIYSRNVKKLRRKQKVILANIVNGKWIQISEEVFSILEEFLKLDLHIGEISNIFEDKEDEEFFENVITQMLDMGIVLKNNQLEEEQHNLVSYEMTSQCNLKCTHCCVDAGGSKSTPSLDTKTSKLILKKIVEWNPKAIMLSGGEPMFRKDFFELLTYLRKIYIGKIILSTNATLISEENVDILSKNVEQFEISIDGVNEETCAMVRGNGVFERVVESIKLLKENGVANINLSMVVCDKNENLKEEFKRLNERLGTTPLFRQFAAVGRGKDNKKQFTDFGENEIYIPTEYLGDDYHNSPQICHCGAGRSEVFIKSNGDVYPCVSYTENEYKLGNLCTAEHLSDLTGKCISIERVYDAEKKKGANLGCEHCDVNLFCWTCPSVFFEMNTVDALRYNCEKLKPVLIKRIWGE